VYLPCPPSLPVVLESLGQQHWVDFGSLLGLIRGGDLILHDNDVDVVVLNPNWPELQASLEKSLKGRYRVGVVHPSEDPSVMWLRVYSLFGMMDIYGAYDRCVSGPPSPYPPASRAPSSLPGPSPGSIPCPALGPTTPDKRPALYWAHSQNQACSPGWAPKQAACLLVCFPRSCLAAGQQA